MPTKILFVCLGNICRSPAAEAVFLKMLETRKSLAKYEIDSAGTGGWHVGKKADERMRKAASKRGIEIKSLSRQISVKDFQEFDLILTMDYDNLANVKSLLDKTSNQCHAVIKPVLSYASSSSLMEVPDPYYGGEQGFEDVLDLLEDACEGLFMELNQE